MKATGSRPWLRCQRPKSGPELVARQDRPKARPRKSRRVGGQIKKCDFIITSVDLGGQDTRARVLELPELLVVS